MLIITEMSKEQKINLPYMQYDVETSKYFTNKS